MTFLNPFALIGLAAATIPVLLHFFNLRKLRTIEFSTLSFLKELQKTKIRRLKLRQLLLLFLRTMLVIFVVLAFSRPTLTGSLPSGIAERAKTTAVIILDDSQSMTANDEQGELLLQAKNAATYIVNLLKDGDEVFLVKLSEVPLNGTVEIPSAQRNFATIRNAINNTRPSFIHRKIESALRFSARLLTVSRNFNKEVYLISDFQSGSLESSENRSVKTEILFSPMTHFFLVPLGKRELQNASIEAIEIENAIIEINKPFSVKVKIANYGTASMQNHIISVFQDGSRVAQKGIDIASGQFTNVEFTLVPKHSGYIEGTIELEDDDLEFDNRRYFTVEIPHEIRLMLVGNEPDIRYIQLALTTRLSDSSAALKLTKTTWDRFSTSQLQNADVIIFSNPHALTQDQSISLKTFLQNGGGLLLFPGNQSLDETFNTTLASPLGISNTKTPEKQTAQMQVKNSFIEFDKTDFRHPIFSGMFENPDIKRPIGSAGNKYTLESPRVYTSLNFVPTSHSQIIITLTNSFPFLIEERIGSGRALLVSVAANTEWSDLPLKGLFVPLVHRSIAYLAQPSTTSKSLIVGDEITINVGNLPSRQLTIIKPVGIEVLVHPLRIGNNKIVRFTDTDTPGIYSLKTENGISKKFSANVDAHESITFPSNNSQRERLLKKFGVMSNSTHIVTQPQNIQHTIMETRLGTELWKHLLFAAILIAFIEMFVARESKRALAPKGAQAE